MTAELPCGVSTEDTWVNGEAGYRTTWTPPPRNVFTKFKFIKQQSRYFSPVQITIMQKQSTSNQLCAPVSHKSSVKLHSVICAFCQTSPHISQDSRRIANKWQSLSIHLQACMNSWHLPRANKVQKQIKHPCFYTFLTPRKALKHKSCAFFSNMKRTCSCRWFYSTFSKDFIQMIFVCCFLWSLQVKWILL